MDSPTGTPRATTPYPAALSADKLSRLQSRPLIQTLLRLFTQKPDETLLSFDQVQALLRSRMEFDRGTQLIPIDHIIGSVGRYRDFDRAFLPLSGADAERWKRLDVAMNELRDLPPIEVYQIRDVYFVRDGNHRVSVAKANGLTLIEAHVTEIESLVPLGPDTDVDDLIIKAEYAHFLKQTLLNLTRPESGARGAGDPGVRVPGAIELTEPGRYRILLEHIEVHRYYLGLQWDREPTLEEAAASWYDTVYQPVVAAIRDSGVLNQFPQRTEADLYLWVAYHRERLRHRYGGLPPDSNVVAELAEQFSGRPIQRFVKAITRAFSAAVKAAAETPEPPEAGLTGQGGAGPD